MRSIRGMKRGVKMEPKLSAAERIQQLDAELKGVQMASRIAQSLMQQLLQNNQVMSQDLGKAYGIINELQYKVLAMQSVGNFDMSLLAKKADELRLKDFTEASDTEDALEGLSPDDVVREDSTVVITSVAADDQGIFRSRIKLAECGVPALIEGLTDKPVGTKVNCQLNGLDHTVELLSIRTPSRKTPAIAEEN